ncbi:ATP-binding cassette domain-containing protein [Sorangium sp. So ce118]
MSMIALHDIGHEYVTYRKMQGLRGSLRDFFRREAERAVALAEVTLRVSAGEIVGLLGPNGAGKTTLMKILSGLVHPSRGQVEVIGEAPYRKSARFLRQIGLVLGQKSQLTWDLPPTETLAVLQAIYRIEDREYRRRLGALVEMLDVGAQLHTPVRKLSLGERMKFELIAALIHQPRLLLLDEPTIGLDIASQRAIRSFLREARESLQTTIVVTSHYARDIEVLADRLVILKHGRIHYDGSLADLLTSHRATRILRIEADSVPAGYPLALAPVSRGVWECEVAEGELCQVLAMVARDLVVREISTQERPLEDVLYALFAQQSTQEQRGEPCGRTIECSPTASPSGLPIAGAS